MQIHGMERRLVEEPAPRHHHARHPEEQNLRGGDQHIARIKRLQVGRLIGPAEGREGPQPRRKPRVEYVVVLTHRAMARRTCGHIGARHERFLRAGRVVAVPHGHAMAPPDLARDVPVADAFQPIHVHGFPTVGQNAQLAAAQHVERLIGERAHAHEPLVGQARLDHGVAAVAVTHRVGVGLDLHQRSRRLEQRDDGGAGLGTIQPRQRGRHTAGGVFHFTHDALGIDDDRHGQAVALAHLEVVGIVCGGDLHGTGAERRVGVRIGDDRNAHAVDRQYHLLADHREIAFVLRVHGDRHVAEHRFRARGGHGNRLRRVVGERVLQVVQFARCVGELRLFIRQRGAAARAPMDDAMAFVHEAVFVQAHERFAYRLRESGGERVGGARPVGARSDRFELIQDLAAGVLHELGHLLHERPASHVEARLAGGSELLFHDVLRGDAGVVGARQPERLIARHTAPADEHVLYRVVEAMPHVQHRRHIGRRNHNDERLARGGAFGMGGEHPVLGPLGVPGGLSSGSVVGRRQRIRVGRGHGPR